MTKLLFVCSQGENRSCMGKEMFEKLGYETKAAGIYSLRRPLTEELLMWADRVIVFEQEHVDFINAHWPDLVLEKHIFIQDFRDRAFDSLKRNILAGRYDSKA